MSVAAPANSTQIAGLLDELQAIRQRAAALLARVTDDAMLAWQPRDGRAWSVGQCLDHLTRTNRAYLSAIRDALAGAPRAAVPVTAPILSTWIGRWFVKTMEPGTRKLPTLRTLMPGAAARRAEVVPAFERSLDEIEALLLDAAAIDLNRHTFCSPFFALSRIRAGTGFRVLLAHLRRHLHQAERVLDAHATRR